MAAASPAGGPPRPDVSAPPARTIDEVVAQMDAILAWCLRTGSRLGYFAALYRKVTVTVRDGIAHARFSDGARMERLAVTFANRYLDAWKQYHGGAPASRCWTAAFRAAGSRRLLVYQHLAMGMVSHIAYDLGIAAEETSPGTGLPALRGDFDEINAVLGELLDGVQEKLGRISPWLRFLDRLGGRADELVAALVLEADREGAWRFAEELAGRRGDERARRLRDKDGEVEARVRWIRRPGWLVSLVVACIRARESWNTRRNIEVLSG